MVTMLRIGQSAAKLFKKNEFKNKEKVQRLNGNGRKLKI
jgi:hypothetical protein